MRKNTILYALILVTFGSCNGQNYEAGTYQKVLPGDGMMNLDKITPHNVRYSRSNGSMTYRMEEVKKNDRDLFRLSILLESKGNKYPDTIYFDKSSFGLAGRALLNRKQGFKANILLDKTELSASIDELPGKTVAWKGDYTYSYPHELFEIAVLNYAIKTLPLKDDFKASVPVYLFDLKFAVGWVDVIVVGKEKLKIKGESYSVWKVDALGGKIGDKTFWISDKLPYPLKIESKGLTAWTFDGEISD